MTPHICLEIGSGSGAISAHLASVLHGYPALYLATDLNPGACRATVRTATANEVLYFQITTQK